MLGFGLKRLDLLWRGIFRHCHQNLGQVDVHGRDIVVGRLFAQELVNLQVSDLHPGIDFTLPEAAHQQLVAQLFTKDVVGNAVGDEAAAQFFD